MYPCWNTNLRMVDIDVGLSVVGLEFVDCLSVIGLDVGLRVVGLVVVGILVIL